MFLYHNFYLNHIPISSTGHPRHISHTPRIIANDPILNSLRISCPLCRSIHHLEAGKTSRKDRERHERSMVDRYCFKIIFFCHQTLTFKKAMPLIDVKATLMHVYWVVSVFAFFFKCYLLCGGLQHHFCGLFKGNPSLVERYPILTLDYMMFVRWVEHPGTLVILGLHVSSWPYSNLL